MSDLVSLLERMVTSTITKNFLEFSRLVIEYEGFSNIAYKSLPPAQVKLLDACYISSKWVLKYSIDITKPMYHVVLTDFNNKLSIVKKRSKNLVF